MTPPNLVLGGALLLSGLTCLAVVLYLWTQCRSAPGARSLIVVMLGLCWWDITYALFWAGMPGPVPNFWMDITMVGAYVFPPAFLIFCLEFSQIQVKWMKPIIAALSIEPVIVFILQWTDARHHLYFGAYRSLSTTNIPTGGPVFWFHVYYAYGLVFLGVVILGVLFARVRGLYRQQTALILAAVIVPWAINIVSVAGLGLDLRIDMTPFIFTFTGLLVALALVRYHLLDIVPVARSLLLENMNDGVVVIDLRNRIVELNPVAQRMLGRPIASVYGQPLEQVLATWSALISQFRGTERAHTEIEVEYEGRPLTLDLNITPVLDYRSQVVGRLIVWRDISQLKQVQKDIEAAHKLLEQRVLERTAELSQANEALEKALRARDEFLAAISHELRTPLTAILGLAEALQYNDFGSMNEKQMKVVGNIADSGRQLNTLVNDVLDYSGLQSGQVTLHLSPTLLRPVCESALRKVRIQAEAKLLAFDFVMDPPEITLMADPRRLQHILVNLLDNAVKFTPHQGRIGLAVNGLPEDRQVRLSVSDTGIGIPPEKFPILFDPFVQLDGGLTRQFGGTGLGLALVKKLVDLHGGQIAVHSLPGQGSCFTLTFPWVE